MSQLKASAKSYNLKGTDNDEKKNVKKLRDGKIIKKNNPKIKIGEDENEIAIN